MEYSKFTKLAPLPSGSLMCKQTPCPVRVLPRCAIDTSVIRHMAAGHPLGARFDELLSLRTQFRFSLAFHTFVELLEDLEHGDVEWAGWARASPRVSKVLDHMTPVLPGLGDLMGMMRNEDLEHAPPYTLRRLRQMWNHVKAARSQFDLLKPAQIVDVVGRDAPAPLNPSASTTVLKHNRETLLALLKPFQRLRGEVLSGTRPGATGRPGDQDGPPTLPGMIQSIHDSFSRNHGSKVASRVEAMIAMLARYIFLVNKMREPYVPENDRNKTDGTDWFQTMVLGVPAYLISNDKKLAAKLKNAGAKQAKYVLNLDAFLDGARLGTLPALEVPT